MFRKNAKTRLPCVNKQQSDFHAISIVVDVIGQFHKSLPHEEGRLEPAPVQTGDGGEICVQHRLLQESHMMILRHRGFGLWYISVKNMKFHTAPLNGRGEP